MRSIAGDSTVCLVLLLFVSGCIPNAPQSQNPILQQGSTERSLRTKILKRIEGKGEEEKLAILLDIISKPIDRPLRRDAILFLSGTLEKANILSHPIADLLLVEPDTAVVNDLEHLLANKEFDVDHYLLDVSLTANESQHLRIIKVLGLRKTATPESMNYLRKHLTTGNSSMLMKACEAIVEIGPPARVLLPELVAVAAQPRIEMTPNNPRAARESRDKTYAAARAINAIGPNENAVDTLRKLLAMEALIATQAAEALAQLESKATAAIPELKQLLNRDDHGGRDVKTKIARDSAEKALGRIARSVAP
jgi:HEAT repeat protein